MCLYSYINNKNSNNIWNVFFNVKSNILLHVYILGNIWLDTQQLDFHICLRIHSVVCTHHKAFGKLLNIVREKMGI